MQQTYKMSYYIKIVIGFFFNLQGNIILVMLVTVFEKESLEGI